MGTTLTGTRISDTYDSLLKATDNGIITSSAKQITDGVGNNTPLYISTSRIGIGVSPTTTFQVSGNSKIGGDLTVTGNLLVEGTTTTVDTDTLSVKDPLIIVGNDNNTSDLVDLGFYGLYDTSGSQDLYAGLYRSASDTKFHLFKDLQEEPTTTVNTSGTGYAVASLVANLEGNVIGDVTGNVTGDLTGNVTATSVLADGVTATTQSDGDNSTKVATTAYVDSGLAGQDTLSEILSGGNTTGGTDIAVSAGDDITFTDTSKSIYGTGGELEIHHNGSNSYITEDGTGALYLQGTYMYLTKSDGSQNYIELDLDGATDSRVKLNYGGATKLQTTNTGLTVTGIISGLTDPSAAQDAATKAYVDSQVDANNELSEVLANGNTSGTNDIIMADDQKVNYGTDSDLQIYHDGSDSYIKDSGTGNLKVLTNSIEIKNAAGTKNLIVGEETTGVELYAYNNSTNSLEKVFYTQDAGSGSPASFFEEQLYIKSGTGSGSTFGNLNYYTEGSGSERGGININGGNGTSGLRMFIGTAWIQSLPDAGAILGVVEFFPSNNPTTSIAKYQFTSGDAYFGNSSEDVDVNIKGALDVTQNATFAGNVGIGATSPSTRLTVDVPAILNNTVNIFQLGGDTNGLVFKKFWNLSGIAWRLNKGVSGVNMMTFSQDGKVGIGTDSPSTKLHVSAASSNSQLTLERTGSATGKYGIYTNTNNLYINNVASSSFPLVILNNGNVGIGTTSPSNKLDVAGNVSLANYSGTGENQTILAQNSYGQMRAGIRSGIPYIGSISPLDFALYTGNSERMRIDSSGNVGIGETDPSGYWGQANNIVIDTSGNGGITIKSTNAGNGRLVFTDTKSTTAGNTDGGMITYSHNDDEMRFQTNGSQKMVIDSSGNVGIGQTSIPSTVLLDLKEPDSGSDLIIGLGAGTGARAQIRSISQSSNNTAELSFYTVTGNTAGERMRITSGGGVSIGSTNPSLDTSLRVFKAGTSVQARIGESNSTYSTLGQNSLIRFQGRNTADAKSVYGDIGLDVDNQLLIFNDPGTTGGTIGTNPMVLDSSGNVGIGITPSAWATDFSVIEMSLVGASIWASSYAANFGANIYQDTASTFKQSGASYAPSYYSQFNGAHRFYSGSNVGANTSFVPSERMRLTSGGDLHVDGDVVAYSTTISDKRLKDDVKPLKSSLDKVMNLKGVEYVWNNGSRKGQKDIGFIAQEVENIIPEIVREKEVIFNKEEKYKTVDYEKITAVLVEAVKELTAKVERLENKCK